MVVVLAGIATEQWIRVQRGRRVVASVLAIGVSDHVQCAIKGHNYPDIANPPEKLRQQLGPQYAGLLDVVQQKLPGFEILEAHICTIPGSPRKYVHFITRGRGTILSVILTRRDGEQLPNGKRFISGSSGGVNLYEAHLDGMNAAGFESTGYFGFVVSDLSPAVTEQIASELAPPLKAALDAGRGSEARLDLRAVPLARERAARSNSAPGGVTPRFVIERPLGLESVAAVSRRFHFCLLTSPLCLLTFFRGAAALAPNPSNPAILPLICTQHRPNFFVPGNRNEPEWYFPSEGALLTDSAVPPAAIAARGFGYSKSLERRIGP